MNKYKTGDKVKVGIILDDDGRNYDGGRSEYNRKTCTIKDVYDPEAYGRNVHSYSVIFDDNTLNSEHGSGTFIVYENEIVKPVKATSLAKKMYPNRREEDGYLI